MLVCLIFSSLFSSLKAGLHLNAIFRPLNMALLEISLSRFKQSNSLVVKGIYVMGVLFNILVVFGYVWKETVFLKELAKI